VTRAKTRKTRNAPPASRTPPAMRTSPPGRSVATSPKAGSLATASAPALYLALEDTPRRLKDRLGKVLGPEPVPSTLTITVSCPPLPQGGDQRIAAWLDRSRDARLVAIDVFARVRGPISRDVSLYDADYAAMARAKALADAYSVPFIVVHHTRKLAGTSSALRNVASAGLAARPRTSSTGCSPCRTWGG
jgi:hypothetical protein